jgi:hypothetical protein
MNFLVIMKEVMPIGGDEWDEVLDRHSVGYPDSLRRKFSQFHRKSTPTGDPVCSKEVKLAKRVKYRISSRADVGDGNEQMDLATGIFTNVHDLEEETDAEDNNMERLVDEEPGDFDAPRVPNDDLLLLANAVEPPNSNRLSAQEEDNDSIKTSDIGGYQDLPLQSSRPTTPPTALPTTPPTALPTTSTALPTTPTTHTRSTATPTSRG